MGEIVNLRQARKAKKRREDERQADENRARFGQTKSQRLSRTADRIDAQRKLDAHKRET